METKKIRERLTEQRAIYKASLENSERAVKKIKSIIDSIDQDSIKQLELQGLNVSVVQSFDLERMKTDKEYLQESQAKLTDVITALHQFLEDRLDV